MDTGQVLVGGTWRDGSDLQGFDAVDPRTREPLGRYPYSEWEELDAALAAGHEAYLELERTPPERISAFLEHFAEQLGRHAPELADIASRETALPMEPRLRSVELPRTIDQLRQAARAARARAWRAPTLSPQHRIAAYLGPLPGIVCVLGPNNFPFAFNGVCGGDAAAAFATGHPVIAKANPGHPETTRQLAEIASVAAESTGMPTAMIQLIYRTSHADGERLVGDSRIAATAFTGGRSAGLALKTAADQAGRPIYLEMSSVNPVVILPGALEQRGNQVASELVASLLLGSGQFCTSPGLFFVLEGTRTEMLRTALKTGLEDATPQPLLAATVADGLQQTATRWESAGATRFAQSRTPGDVAAIFPNSMYAVSGEQFVADPKNLQAEAFGNCSLLVTCRDLNELECALRCVEGSLTTTVYSASDGNDESAYARIVPILRRVAGRLLENKAPTGVAVVAAMNHGGPYPATGHPGFTAVGVPNAMVRFGMLQCFDNVEDDHLPPELQADNPLALQRFVDGTWTDEPVTWGSE